MRRVGGAIAEAVTAGALIGAVGAMLLVQNSDHRTSDDIAAFHAAQTRASSDGLPLEGRHDYWGRISIFPVIEDGTLNPVPDGIAGDIWAAFLRMVTPRFAAENMSALLIASDPDNPVTAAVERASVRPLRWSLAVNVAAETQRADYLRTLVHEYAHLLMLGDDDLDPFAVECRTMMIQEGCLLPDSTLERFQERFWRAYGEDAPSPDSTTSPASWQTYFKHTGAFVSVYAATNVVEDLAETFTEFVIRDRPDRESGTWAEKILFFWEHPEYVAIRAHIRGWFGPELPEPLLPTSTTHRG